MFLKRRQLPKMKTAKTLSVNLMMTSTATGIGADLANPVAAAGTS